VIVPVLRAGHAAQHSAVGVARVEANGSAALAL